MRKTLSVILSVLMILSVLCFGVSAAPAGTAVKTAEDFAAMDPAGTYYLDADITLKTSYGAGETPVVFAGTFDGNGHTVTTEAPLFVKLSGSVKNLTVKGNITVTGESAHAGAIAGEIVKESVSVLENITNNANITADYRTGGLVGQVSDTTDITVKNCVNNGKLVAGNMMGGIIGYMQGSKAVVTDCVNNGDVTIDIARDLSGLASGIIGRFGGDNAWVTGEENNRNIVISNCLNNGKVIGTSQAAGILAHARGCVVKISNCTNKGSILSDYKSDGTGTSDAAGIFGSTDSSKSRYCMIYIDKCLNEGDCTSKNARAGGIVGYIWCGNCNDNYLHGVITNCVNKGAIAGGSFVSEIVAYTNDTRAGKEEFDKSGLTTITNCVGMGSVKRADGATREEAKTYTVCMGFSSATIPAGYNWDVTMVENDGTKYFGYTETEANAANIIELAGKPDTIRIVSAADAKTAASKIDKLGYQAPAAPVTPADPGTPVKPVQTADTAVYFVAAAVVAVLGCALVSRKVSVK